LWLSAREDTIFRGSMRWNQFFEFRNPLLFNVPSNTYGLSTAIADKDFSQVRIVRSGRGQKGDVSAVKEDVQRMMIATDIVYELTNHLWEDGYPMLDLPTVLQCPQQLDEFVLALCCTHGLPTHRQGDNHPTNIFEFASSQTRTPSDHDLPPQL